MTEEKGWLKYLSGIIKEIGIPGFAVVFMAFALIFWATSKQKEEFIDTFILFKNDNPYPCVIVVSFMGILMILGTIYYQKMLNLRKQENNRIGLEKSKWQEMALNRKLNSSK